MHFEARLSLPIKLISAVITAFLALIFIHQIYLGLQASGGFTVAGMCTTAFMVAVFFIMSWGRPIGYTLHAEGLEIMRWKRKSMVIPLEKIETAEVSTIDFRKCIRLFGNGGFFGMYGKFKEIGGPKFTACIIDTKNAVMLKTKNGLIVISPSERALFLAKLNDSLGKS